MTAKQTATTTAQKIGAAKSTAAALASCETPLQRVLVGELAIYETEEIEEIEAAMIDDDHRKGEWKVLGASTSDEASNTWIWLNEYGLTFFDVYSCDYVDLNDCCPDYIVKVAEELGEEVVNDFYSDELEAAKEEINGWANEEAAVAEQNAIFENEKNQELEAAVRRAGYDFATNPPPLAPARRVTRVKASGIARPEHVENCSISPND